MEVDMLNKVLKSRVETALINIKIGELTLIYPDKSVIRYRS